VQKLIAAIREYLSRGAEMSAKQEYVDTETESLLISLSHEVLDKVQAIRSCTTLVLDLDEDSAKKGLGLNQREWMEAILMEIDDIPFIVRDLCGIVRLLHSAFEWDEYATTTVNLKAMLQDIINTLSTLVPHRQLRISMDAETASALVHSFDKSLLYRSLELMLGYLTALTPDGEVLQINLNASENRIHLVMHGKGVKRLGFLSPAETTQKLLENAPSIGTGMGVARKTIQYHRGNVQSDDQYDWLSIDLPSVSQA
jgi:K+-sensing histidine kinase KdpD